MAQEHLKKLPGICECGEKCDNFLDFVDHARQAHPNESVTWSHNIAPGMQYADLAHAALAYVCEDENWSAFAEWAKRRGDEQFHDWLLSHTVLDARKLWLQEGGYIV